MLACLTFRSRNCVANTHGFVWKTVLSHKHCNLAGEKPHTCEFVCVCVKEANTPISGKRLLTARNMVVTLNTLPCQWSASRLAGPLMNPGPSETKNEMGWNGKVLAWNILKLETPKMTCLSRVSWLLAMCITGCICGAVRGTQSPSVAK